MFSFSQELVVANTSIGQKAKNNTWQHYSQGIIKDDFFSSRSRFSGFHECRKAYYYQISEKSGSYVLRIGGILLRIGQGSGTA
jgi:hypothetical protein